LFGAAKTSEDLLRRHLRRTKSLRYVAAGLQKVLIWVWDTTRTVFDDVMQVKYIDEITLVVGNEACDLDSGRQFKT
jgi:hypothetical protein